MDRAAGLNPTDASFWNERGLSLSKTNRLDEALHSYTKAIELSGPWQESQALPGLGYRNRMWLNRRLNRVAEAAADCRFPESLQPPSARSRNTGNAHRSLAVLQ